MKTKSILLGLITLAFIIGSASCEKENPNNIQLKDFTFSQCKESSESPFDKHNEYIDYKAAEGNYLLITHHNALFNCCPGTLSATLGVKGKGLLVNEKGKESLCNCVCLYDLTYKIGPLSAQKYKFSLHNGYKELSRFSFTYSPTLSGRAAVKE